MTYKQISKLTNKSIGNIRSLAHKLNTERVLIKGVTHISKEGVETLQAHFAPKTIKTNSRSKIRVMERYFKTQCYRDIARTCNISRQTVRLIVEEWEIDGHITVDSSINFPKKIQNKGIFKKGTKWGYCLVKNGVKYYKSGFEEELRAVEELTRIKENLNNQN